MTNYLSDRSGADIDSQLDKADTLLTPASGESLYHTGSSTVEAGAFDAGGATGGTRISSSGINLSLVATTLSTAVAFYNPNGNVGTIRTDGTATSYNTSSDPRLKQFTANPTDAETNAEFDKVFSCFRTFNWKNNLGGSLVWGFDAHACIDAGTDIGSEGEGPRDLPLGSVYETIPPVTEARVVLDSNGLPTTEIETVIVTPAIEKRVTPAGVDQSKVTPVLLAKIEQLERRLTAAGF